MPQKQLYTGIKSLYGIETGQSVIKKGKDLSKFDFIENAWLLVSETGHFEAFGTMDALPEFSGETINCEGKFILPAFVDSHTHLVHAGSRENEFVDRISGLTYEDIAARGGGIINSVKKLRNTSENELFEKAYERLIQAINSGTGAIEIKSGYGLDLENELKMLRVIQRLKEVSPIQIKSTFLGAHAIPTEFAGRREDYVNYIVAEMLPAIAKENLADYIDLFCETNYFTCSDLQILLEAGAKFGLKGKVHVNQFNSFGGVKTAVENKALSIDHLEVLTDEDLLALQNSETIPVALPGCSFFIKIPYTPAKSIIEAGLPIALATDYNPGSTPSLSMPFVISLACIYMGMLPEQAFNAATINGAAALELLNSHGSIAIGKKATFIITKKVSSLNYLPYSFTENWIDKVIV